MNLQLIKTLCEKRKGGIRGLSNQVGMTEQNLHRCIRENKIQAQDLEAISKALGVTIGYFFDEEAVSVRVEANHGSAASLSGSVSVNSGQEKIERLETELKYLREKLADKEKIISLYEKTSK